MRFLKLWIAIGVVLLPSLSAFAQSKFTISGYVRDASNGEAMIGATVLIKESGGGVSTNVYGFYAITLPAANYTLIYSYIGFEKRSESIQLNQDIRLDIEIKPESEQLDEVVVQGDDQSARLQNVEMSTHHLDIKTMQKIPAFLGEVDVVRSLQALPGISTVGEGASGYNSRGGSVGQNLILLDEAPVYNSSHMLGFFSVFNPDAVKDTKLYKGGIPSRYGGRLSSILDVRMKEGNSKNLEATGGVGTIFSRFALEGPILKEKGSFIVAVRRSYIDILARPFVKVLSDGGALNFYDLTMKVNYRVSNKDRLYLSGYFGRDNFFFSKNQGFSWGNETTTLRWNHLFNKRLFSNVTGIYSNYSYRLQFGADDLNKFKWNSSISNLMLKPELTYFINANNELSFGGEAAYYTFVPAISSGITNGQEVNISLEKKYNLETSLYLAHSQRLGSAISIEYGIRYSQFRYFGPGTEYIYNDTVPGVRKSVVGYKTYGRNETIAQYGNWQPRLSATWQVDARTSFKASYNRMVQYLHLISNTTASNPLDVWTPSSNHIMPELGDQVTAGYFHNFNKKHQWEMSIETYLRLTRNQIEYIDGADLLINKYLEGDLLSGLGRAYGMEFYLHRNTGRLNGWISYTLARTELKVDGINRNEWYPTRFDQRHNLKIVAFYEINKRWSASLNFAFTSGTPTTFPTSRYVMQDILIPYNANDSRNNVRIPSYHRLDLSFRLEGKKYKGDKLRKNHDYWVFSVYNVYARKNPFSIYFSQGDNRVPAGTAIQSQAKQLSIIGTFVPAISYNFNF